MEHRNVVVKAACMKRSNAEGIKVTTG